MGSPQQCYFSSWYQRNNRTCSLRLGILATTVGSQMFTHPQDYSHVSLQRPLLANESHLAKQGPIRLRLSPSLAQQSICCLVNLQKQCRAFFPFTMASTEKALSSPLLSHLFFRYIYFSDVFIFPDQYEQCCHQCQTSVVIEIWAHTSESGVKYSQTIFGTRHHESLSLVGQTVLSLFVVLSTYAHEESHKHQQESLVCKLITK